MSILKIWETDVKAGSTKNGVCVNIRRVVRKYRRVGMYLWRLPYTPGAPSSRQSGQNSSDATGQALTPASDHIYYLRHVLWRGVTAPTDMLVRADRKSSRFP